MQRKATEGLRKLNCSENVNGEEVQQWINNDLKLEFFEVLSDGDIMLRVGCGYEEIRNFENCPESKEENLETHTKLSHGDAVHTEVFLD